MHNVCHCFALLLLYVWLDFAHSLSAEPVIRVCQNKHCCKKSPHLLQTISQLATPALVESSGCLSHCDEGPNVEIENDSSSILLHGIIDATTAALELEQALNTPIPKVLVAASKLMERVHSMKDPSEQLRFLNSVISKLQDSPEHAQSAAISHAFALRAQVFLTEGDNGKAIEDAMQALKLRDYATQATRSLAYRVWADAEEENPQRMLVVLQKWHAEQPKFRLKLKKEMQCLLETIQSTGKV